MPATHTQTLRCLSSLAALLVLLSATPALAGGPHALYHLLHERLALMDDVAAHKWARQQPIDDPAREAVVIERSASDALRRGVSPDSSRALFAAQIEAAKEIQRHWFARWQSGAEPPPAAVADLDRELRPKLLRLGDAIVAAAATRPPLDRTALERAVTVEGLSPAGREALIDAIFALRVYPNRLAQILDTGVLRVGTTGDYAPFSLRPAPDQAFSGIDVDLGRDLAAALGVAVEFVETSWPRLGDDLVAGRFDIAMSGVSRTLDRQRIGFFSRPYHVGGKTPLVRCADAPDYGSLEAIDRPGVRVIVNPGGTNEQFVDARIQRARKILHDDNRTIFERIVRGEADVMITDRIEAEWQSARNPQLCTTMEGNLTYQEKAYLMPQDIHLKEFVDGWLALRLGDGRIDAALRPPAPML